MMMLPLLAMGELLMFAHDLRVSRRDTIDRHYLGKLGGFGAFLHYVHHDDPDLFHTHPWDGISFIFGSYDEERMGETPARRRFFNVIRAHRPHRVTLPRGPVFTLFIHGRRKNRWSVRARDGRVVDIEPWRGVGGRTSYGAESQA